MQKRRISLCRIASITLAVVILASAALAYSHYLTLKRLLLSEISRKITATIGQGVRIGDLSYGAPSEIRIDDIVVENPEGFGEGQLLKVKRVSLQLRYRELLSGTLSFRIVEVEAPELTLMRDRKNRLNISDALRAFFSKEGKTKYEVDTLKVRSGVFDPYDHRFRCSEITVTLNNLSSEPGTKTLIKGTASLGESGVAAEGWAFLKDDPKRFGLSASLKGLSLALFGGTTGKFGFGAGTSTADINLHAEGDTKNGVNLKPEVSLEGKGFFVSRKEITLVADSFFDIGRDSLVVREALVKAAGGSAVRLTGVVNDVTGKPSYRAQMMIDIPDLAAFNLMKGVKLGGGMTSDGFHVEGKFDTAMPGISGSLELHNVSLDTADVRAEGIDAKIIVSSAREINAEVEGEARVLRAGKYSLLQPAEVKVTIKARGKPGSLALVSSVGLSPIHVNAGQGKDLRIGSMDARMEGNLRGRIFSGETSAKFEGIKYADYTVGDCFVQTGLDYGKNIITLKDPEVKSEKFSLSAGVFRIAVPERKGSLRLEAKNLGVSFPEKKAAVRKLDCSARLTVIKEGVLGDMVFSGGEIIFRDARSGVISGKASLDRKDFSLTMTGNELFQGTTRLSAEGAVSGGPFPMTLAVEAEDTDLDGLVKAASGFFEIPYRLSGKMDRASFRGTVESMDSVRGSASVETKNLAVLKAEGNKAIVKDALLNAGTTFRGKDMDFNIDAATVNLSARVSGTIKGFMEKEKSVRAEAVIPEVKIADIRSTLWEVFPDTLLYAGLEGSLSADVMIGYRGKDLTAEGEIRMKGLVMEGENNEYSIGPINGALPLHYSSAAGSGGPLSLPMFDRAEFKGLGEYYATMQPGRGFQKMTIGNLRYGFRLLQDIEIWASQAGRYLNVGRFGATIFGGRLDGSAVVTLSGGLSYRAGMIVKGISLTTLCDDITPIKGYITGKVDGVGLLKGSGGSMKDLIGRVDLWAYSAGGEKTKISREFLQKMGGPSMKKYLGERSFDKGIISMYIESGFLVFKELEISHTNFLGMTDLSVKVAPFNNRISLDHFLSTIAEAADRAGEK
jgi:hypothetical protein